MSQEKLCEKLLALVRKRSFLRCFVASQDFSTLAQNERYFSVPSHQLTKLFLSNLATSAQKCNFG